MSLISRNERALATIGALDLEGVVSVWSVIELYGQNLESEADINFNMGIGSKVKLPMNYTENLARHPEVLSEDGLIGGFCNELIDLEFNP